MTTELTTPAPDSADRLSAAVERVAGWMQRLIDPGQIVELRALRVQDGARGGTTWAGTFAGDELPDLCRAALNLSGHCQGVYFTMNPLRPERHTKDPPRVRRRGKGETAEDADVLARRWVLVDVDPVREKRHEKDSATDAEKAAAWEVLTATRAYLATVSDWPAPVVCDSGNGYHLLYRLDDAEFRLPLSADDPLRQLLRHLADRFDTPAATIDTSVFNPSRIVKFPGTMACKGTGEGDRPHRRARVLEVPA